MAPDDEDPEKKTGDAGRSEPEAYRIARRALELTNARIRQLEAETFERMSFPANMGWFQGDTEPVEVVYWITREGELVQLIADTDTPWPMRGEYVNPLDPWFNPADEKGNEDGEKE